MRKIEWIPPEPRKGLSGQWDKFVGPGATNSEEYLQLIGGILLAVMLGVFLWLQRDTLGWSGLQVAIVALFIADISGGIITNATSAAKRWYHRPGQHTLRAHLPFIATHGIHLLGITVFFRDMDWAYFMTMYAFLMGSTVLLIKIPLHLQRPLGMTLYPIGILLGMYAFVPSPGLEWFLPFFYLKLLISHLLVEAPFSPDEEE